MSSDTALSVWQTQALRLTAFPGPGFTPTDTTWWADLVGQPPESRSSQPRLAMYSSEGPFDQGTLALRLQFDRIDWFLSAPDRPSSDSQALPTLGGLPTALSTFVTLMSPWLDSDACPPLLRLAFGAVLLQQVATREEGYRRLAPYLSAVQLDPLGSSDFLYRINRPRDSAGTIEGLRINRLSTWSVVLQRAGMIAVRSGTATLLPSSEHYASRLELDINTAPGTGLELPRAQVPQVFQEMVTLGKEIAQEGEIP